MSSFKFKVPLSIFVCESNGAFARFSFCTGDCSPLVFCPEVLKEIHLVNSTCCTVHADCVSSGILQMRRGHFDAAMCFQRKLGWNVCFTDFNSCSFKGQNLSVCVHMCVCPLELRVILLFWIHILLICDLLTFSGVWSSCYCLMCFVANL